MKAAGWGPASRVIVIGTASHRRGSVLPPVPAVAGTVEALTRTIERACGLAESQVRTLVDPADPRAMLSAIRDTAAQADDTLLVYYVGHGLLSATGELHLATVETVDLSDGMAPYQALPLAALIDDLVTGCRARSVILVLDCCFAYRAAIPAQMSLVLLASADRDEQALVRPGEPYPVFSGELLKVLEAGDPTGPPNLTIRDVYRRISRQVVSTGAPEPRMQAGDRVADLIWTKNQAYHPRPPAEPDQQDMPAGSDVCPYRGLDPYNIEDAAVFFGRGDLTNEVLGQLTDRYWNGGLHLLLGPSGSGKSSLLQAGVAAAVRNGELGIAGSSGWLSLSFTPGNSPLATLSAKLAGITGADPGEVLRELRMDPAAVRALVTGGLQAGRRAAGVTRRLVIIVDQFEEAFSADVDEADQQAFITALHEVAAPSAGGHGEPTALVLIGLRSEFHGHCAGYPELRHALGRHTVVGAMTLDELTAAITEPARTADLVLQPGLGELLLRDIGTDRPGVYDAGALPYLSFALLSTWQSRRGRTLTIEGYTASGGVAGAIAQAAEATYLALPQSRQHATDAMLMRMVSLGEDVPDTRRKASRMRLMEQQDPDATTDALRVFADARLVTVDGDTVQLSHEALIRSWPRLRALIETDREAEYARQQLTADAERWDAGLRELYRGAELAIARSRIGTSSRPMELTTTARAFLHNSISRERRGRRTRRVVAAAMAGLLVVAVIAAGAFNLQRTAADQQRDQAVSRAVAAEVSGLASSEPGLARQLAIAAYRTSPTNQAAGAVLTSLASPASIDVTGTVTAVADDPVRPLIAVADGDEVELDNPDTGAVAHSLSMTAGVVVQELTFSPDGKVLAIEEDIDVGLGGGEVDLWNVANPARPVFQTRIPAQATGSVTGIALSSNEHLIGVAEPNQEVLIWDVSHPGPPVFETGFRNGGSVAFGPGSIVAVGGAFPGANHATGVALYSLADPARPTAVSDGLTITAPVPYVSITALAFSADGDALAVGASWAKASLTDTLASPTGGDVTIANLTDLTHPRLDTLTWNEPPGQVAFSPDGRILAAQESEGDNAKTQLWDLAAPTPILASSISGKASSIGMAFTPDSSTLITGGGSQVRLWPVSNPLYRDALSTIVAYGQPYPTVTAVAWNPRMRILAMASSDGRIRLWNTVNPLRPAMFSVFSANPSDAKDSAQISSIAFSPDGRFLAVGSDTVRLWNVTSPRHPTLDWTDPQPLKVQSLAFCAVPGQVILAFGTLQAVYLWDREDHSRVVKLTAFDDAASTIVAPQPGGQSLIVIDDDVIDGSAAYRWDINRPEHPTLVPGSEMTLTSANSLNPVYAAAVSPSGQTVAIGLSDGSIQLWRIPSPGQRAVLITDLLGATGSIAALSYSPDGQTLAATDGGALRLWNVGNPAQASLLATPASGNSQNFTAAEFSPDGKNVAVARGPAVDLWDADVPDAITRECAYAGTTITRTQWQTYLGNAAYTPPCVGNP